MKNNLLFEKAVEAGTITPAIVDYLGRGMNVLASTPGEGLLLKIFDWDKSGYKPVEADGKSFEIPEITSILPAPSSYTRQSSQTSISSISDKLTASMGISLKGYGCYSGGIKSNFEMSNTRDSQGYYAYYENNLMFGDIILDNESAQYFTDEFQNDLDALPETYDGSNFAPFGNFFDKWGLYFVSKCSLGGAVNAYNAVSIQSQTSLQSASVDLSAQYKGLFYQGSFDASVTGTSSWQVFSSDSETQLQVFGGSLKTQQALLGLDLLSPGPASVQAGESWADTIASNPYPLDIQSRPIYELAGDKKDAINQASKDYLTSIQFNTSEHLVNPYHDTYGGRSTVLVNNKLVIPTDTANPGFQVVVLQRQAPVQIVSNEFYSYDLNNWQNTYETMYKEMAQNLEPYDESYIVVLCSVNLYTAVYPTPAFAHYLTDVLGVSADILATWEKDSTAAYEDTSQLFYVAGIPNLGPGTASVLSQYMGRSEIVSQHVIATTGATITLKGDGSGQILSFQEI